LSFVIPAGRRVLATNVDTWHMLACRYTRATLRRNLKLKEGLRASSPQSDKDFLKIKS
jgi:hypothetical protein